ncbi:hypothetical protein [Dactylosporangium sp. CA-092794]|uniref:hypothetical protein n=1 Tax=Dactylosporangium sp. CA-092794 TaxID=3239929 RepID=UPI003D930375
MSNETPPGGAGLDHLRPMRRGLAKVVLVFDAFLALIPVILALGAAADSRNLPRSPVLWIGWVLAAGPIAGSFVGAVRLLRTPPDEDREWRLARWTGGLFGLGLVMLIAAGSLSGE